MGPTVTLMERVKLASLEADFEGIFGYNRHHLPIRLDQLISSDNDPVLIEQLTQCIDTNNKLLSTPLTLNTSTDQRVSCTITVENSSILPVVPRDDGELPIDRFTVMVLSIGNMTSAPAAPAVATVRKPR